MSFGCWWVQCSLHTVTIYRCRMKLKRVEKSPARCSHYILNRQLVVRPNFEFLCNIWRAASFHYGHVLRCYLCNTICIAKRQNYSHILILIARQNSLTLTFFHRFKINQSTEEQKEFNSIVHNQICCPYRLSVVSNDDSIAIIGMAHNSVQCSLNGAEKLFEEPLVR